jgi:hypothetical protein
MQRACGVRCGRAYAAPDPRRVLALSRRTPARDSPEMSCGRGVAARLNGVCKPPLLLSIHVTLRGEKHAGGRHCGCARLSLRMHIWRYLSSRSCPAPSLWFCWHGHDNERRIAGGCSLVGVTVAQTYA